MKKIQCYIQHKKLEEVRGKLFELGVPGLSVIDAKGIGKPLSQFESTPDAKVPQFLPRVEITIVLEDEAVDEVVDTIAKTAHTGNLGDGKIFILPVEEAIRIRTGERGKQALY
ncbi:MAG TPA: P-II family nitrogen regulator [Nitrospinaceae bacterium]|jgi:nitrogen regulatory protein P-II 1|nr:transcriptional regulator [Nitrospinota bacterium]MDP6335286.1 P-II family nitrogen regulator [Nitrospinaceae bacterium]MDP7147307.1 P-II family nitrogen regulator [Nitrospinaceae bacterium]HAX45350.1 P-II family nitrogen regulator [Nitrospina sp.]HJO58977.1 P-II family nitrogen regulator [Nitrospinaceae bacterium]|tara:strand:- start:1761 stop:2099 length:339 start_codon:yes stop_codon:yes gene_type:complete